MSGQSLFFNRINQIDLVDFLDNLGYKPQKVKGEDYWYLSPLRTEKTASFKVNRRMNAWYDHGLGKGGGFIDFGKTYYNCSIVDLIAKLEQKKLTSVAPQENKESSKNEKQSMVTEISKIKIISNNDITDERIIKYLGSRKIPLDIAKKYCEQVAFQLYGKTHLVIGFKNSSGGYELRNDYFKGSSSPKDSTLLRQNLNHCTNQNLQVFEGFFSFLSFQTLKDNTNQVATSLKKFDGDNLILNSLSFFERARPLMEKYEAVNLFLDNDAAGIQNITKAIQWSPKYIDQSKLYINHKDLNDYLTNEPQQEFKKNRRKRLRL